MKKLFTMLLVSLSLLIGSTVYAESNTEGNEPTKLLPKDNYTVEKDYIIFSGVTKGEDDKCRLAVELSVYKGMENPDIYTSNTVECGERASITVSNLSNNTWYWRAYTDYKEGYSDYSKVRTFQMGRDNEAPNIPFTQVKNTDKGINLTANVSDPEGDNVRLQFEVSQDINFESYTTYYTGYNDSDSEVVRNIGDLEDGTYYWRVKAHDDWDYSYSEYTVVKSMIIKDNLNWNTIAK